MDGADCDIAAGRDIGAAPRNPPPPPARTPPPPNRPLFPTCGKSSKPVSTPRHVSNGCVDFMAGRPHRGVGTWRPAWDDSPEPSHKSASPATHLMAPVVDSIT